MLRKIIFFTIFCFTAFSLISQRKSENLDRGVIAVKNSSSAYLISWRYLVTDPENVQYNVYAKKSGAGAFSKLNSSPLSITNYQSTTSQVADGTQLYVKTVVNSIEGSQSPIYTINASQHNVYRCSFLNITYSATNDGLDLHQYKTKYVWPVDLNADGIYDYVVDRLSADGSNSHKVQAYLANGNYLWTIDMGPNVSISEGQDDMVIAYDMDGDGYGEVVVKSSDGTAFADGKGVNGSTTLDTDNDGIVNYETQSVRNPPQYISVINGLTGEEKTSIEMTYPSNYSRTNKAAFMSTYSNLNGHMTILYLDGKHPSVGFVYMCRTASDKYHWYSASAWGYNASGQLVNHYNWERNKTDAGEFHSIRAADTDFDGRDELLDGGYGIKYDGSLAFNAHISHGDRFRVGDLNPQRPGMETFAIQQNAQSMLGMLIYDSSTGNAVKKIFMSSMGDVGRGECMDIDSSQIGYEFYSTMPNIYTAKGDVLYEGDAPWPSEGIWWDGDLSREVLSAADGNGFNTTIDKYQMDTRGYSRKLSIYSLTNYKTETEYGARPAFFGDIAGDWREEFILRKKDSDANGTFYPGIVGFSTDNTTGYKIYCLMQNPAYRMQATNKGYYQSPFPDYYLGTGMPTPPIPPVQSAKLTWKTGSQLDKSTASWVTNNETTTSNFTDGDDILFDISGTSTSLTMNTDLAPSKVWAMNPLGKDYSISGTGKFTGSMDLVKSMCGNFTLNGNHTFTGKTIISEGTLTVNGSLASPLELRAKGTLSGNATLNGGITVSKGLNIEGARLAPGNGFGADLLGTITVNSALTLPGEANLHFDIVPGSANVNDKIQINGNFNCTGVNNIIINASENTLPAGTYTLVSWTGSLTGSISNFKIQGIEGFAFTSLIENNSLKLVVNSSRAASNISWSGSVSNNVDYLTSNFTHNSSSAAFVAGDNVTVDDNATSTSLVLNENIKSNTWNFTNNSKAFTVSGTNGISGSGSVTYGGTALVDVQTVNNSYSGITTLQNAQVKITELSEAGSPGALGSAGVDPANLVLNNSTLIINATNTYTNRGLTLTGDNHLNILKSNGIATITGVVEGNGKLIKTGDGQLNLSGSAANTFAGGTQISKGTVALGSITMNNSGLGTNEAVTIEGGGVLKMFDSPGDYNQHPNWNITIPEGNTGTLIASSRCDINGTISGAGTLNFNTPYFRTDLVASGANFTGLLNITTDSDGGDFRITNNSIGFPNAQINLNNLVGMAYYAAVGNSSASTSTTAVIGSLSGTSGSSLNTGKWQIGSDNRDTEFTGTINKGVYITKVGTGTWTLSGANHSVNTINVNAGTLNLANNTDSVVGRSPLAVAQNATLKGIGKVYGVATISGNLQGNIDFINNLTLSSTANTVIVIDGFLDGQFQKINVGGTFAKNGQLEIKVNAAYPSQNISINLYNALTRTGHFTKVILPAMYKFDESTGVLINTNIAEWNGDGNWTDLSKWGTSTLPSSAAKILVKTGNLVLNTDVTVDSMIISGGASVNVESGKSFNTKLVLHSNIVNGTATYINNGVDNITSGTIKQKLVSGRNWYFSSPIKNLSFANIKTPGVSLTFSPPVGIDESEPLSASFWKYNESQLTWSSVTNPQEQLTDMKGYIINIPIDTVIEFNGEFNNGDYSISLTRTSTSSDKSGFNLIGNPYPSYLDWNSVVKTNMESSIWYRSKNISNSYIFDTYNATSGIATSLGQKTVTRLIPPMQAFWVRVAANQSSGTVSTNNSMRFHKDLSGNLFKSPVSENPIIRLRVSNGMNEDETILYLNDEAAIHYDTYDSKKMFNESLQMAEIYTLAGTEKVVINGLPNFNTEIPLGFKTLVNGNFKIKLSDISIVPSDAVVYLKDNYSHIETNLSKEKEYTFSSGPYFGTDRFSVLYKTTDVLSGISNEPKSAKVYVIDGNLYLENIANESLLSIFNVSGIKLVSEKIKAGDTTLKLPLDRGSFIVELKSNSVCQTSKIQL